MEKKVLLNLFFYTVQNFCASLLSLLLIFIHLFSELKSLKCFSHHRDGVLTFFARLDGLFLHLSWLGYILFERVGGNGTWYSKCGLTVNL